MHHSTKHPWKQNVNRVHNSVDKPLKTTFSRNFLHKILLTPVDNSLSSYCLHVDNFPLYISWLLYQLGFIRISNQFVAATAKQRTIVASPVVNERASCGPGDNRSNRIAEKIAPAIFIKAILCVLSEGR
jgi:hypothetical protein